MVWDLPTNAGVEIGALLLLETLERLIICRYMGPIELGLFILGIQSPSENGFMEPKYYAFRRWLDTPIIRWEYDWMPRVKQFTPQKTNMDTNLIAILKGSRHHIFFRLNWMAPTTSPRPSPSFFCHGWLASGQPHARLSCKAPCLASHCWTWAHSKKLHEVFFFKRAWHSTRWDPPNQFYIYIYIYMELCHP